MEIEFTPAKPAEAAELSELRRRVWLTTYRGIYPDEMLDNFDFAFHNERNRFYIRNERFIVYFITGDQKKIGYLILKDAEPFLLQSLYVLAEHRGKGIGRKAFDFVRQFCRERDRKNFILVCHPDNKAAMAFYEKMGGKIISWDIGHVRNEENGVKLEFCVNSQS